MSRQKTRLALYELAFGIAIAIQAFFDRTSRYTSALGPVKRFLPTEVPPRTTFCRVLAGRGLFWGSTPDHGIRTH